MATNRHPKGRSALLPAFLLPKKVAASHHELADYAQLEGVQFEYNKAPVEIARMEGVVFKDMLEDEEGNLTEIPGSSTLYPADSVIISISQGPAKPDRQYHSGPDG